MNKLSENPEGRASARPDSLDRRHPIHLPTLEAHNRSIIIFVTTCTVNDARSLHRPHLMKRSSLPGELRARG